MSSFNRPPSLADKSGLRVHGTYMSNFGGIDLEKTLNRVSNGAGAIEHLKPLYPATPETS